MKILTFGTCRLLMLFDKSVNDTFLDSVHYVNYDYLENHNLISLSHDINQVIYILNLIVKNIKIYENNDNYNLIKRAFPYLNNIGDYREHYLSRCSNYNINESITNINSEINQVKYIILEVCTLKQLIINGIPLFLDINDRNDFSIISDDEFKNNFDILVNLITSINKEIKIIFTSHIIEYNNQIIPDRLHILNLLNELVKKYNNCYVFSPCDYITNEDLEDDRHYKKTSYKKVLTALKDKILDIETNKIVEKLNNTGILHFNIFDFLNIEQKKSYNNLNNTLNNMINNIKNNNNNRIYGNNNYMYCVNNYLQESWNLNNKIFIDFFNIMLCNIITKIAKKYLESDVYIYNCLMAVNYNSDNGRVQSQNWHRDPGGIKIIKFFIFFDDINESNGALEYIPNTQYTSNNKITNLFENNGNSIYPHNYIHTEEYEKFKNIVDNNRYIVSCSDGTCVAIDTAGFHRAGYVESNKYRKYLHVLFLTKEQINNNTDPCDRYQLGFNHNPVYNIDLTNINNYYSEDLAKYFYKI